MEGNIEDPNAVMQQLGGTTVIGKCIAENVEITPSVFASFIRQDASSSVTFGLTSFDSPYKESFLSSIKEELSSQGISTRYIVNKKSEPLSAVVVKGQHVQEYLVIKTETGNLFVKTVAVQNIPEWAKRDFDRPYADPKRGMLPPKVARMLVNIVGSFRETDETATLLDPFCGMGTVLAEAQLMGWNVIGSDIAPDVVSNTIGNLEWLKQEYPSITSIFRVVQSDAVHVSKHVDPVSVCAIVTEPFMGSPSFALQDKVDPEEIRNTIKGLEKLYIGCLKDWHGILRSNGVILMALPRFRLKGREFFVKKVIDSCEMLGYSISEGPLVYGRPNATVERNFYLFQKR